MSAGPVGAPSPPQGPDSPIATGSTASLGVDDPAARAAYRRARRWSRWSRFLGPMLGRFFLTILGASVLSFTAFYILLDPVDLMLPVTASAEARADLKEQLGLDDPLLVQYGRFLGGAVQGDFGISLSQRRPAMEVVMERLPATAILAGSAMLLASVLGLAVGLWASLRPDGSVAKASVVASNSLVSLHDAWISLMLILVFAVTLGWFPTGGGGDWSHLVLPMLALATRPFGRMIQMTTDSVGEERHASYVETAGAKGADERRILFRHKLRSATPAIITFAMYDFGRLFVGTAIIIETTFAWPGIGSLIIQSLEAGDVFLSQAIVVTSAIIVATLNFASDVTHMLIDPRVRV